MTKIALISPKGPLYRHRSGIFRKNLRYMPLTLTTLAALVPSDIPCALTLVDEGIEDIDLNLDADLVGMTVITGCARRAYELASHFRREGKTVVLGGPHVTLMPGEAQEHADAIVTGYAETTWPQLLRDYLAGRLRKRYDQEPDFDLASSPIPRRDLLPRGRYITDKVFEATRGCVHDCEFCVVPSAWGRRPWQKPVENVVADIRQTGAKKLIFVDLNIISDRRHAAELFEALIPLKVQWYGLATTHLVHEKELLALASRSGCRGLLMGLESISPDNLRDSGKKFNSPEAYTELVEILHRHRISLQGCFVFGLDHDTPDIFLKTAKLAVKARIDLPRFAIVTPFPGTKLHTRLEAEGRILTRDWELYDGQHVVFKPLLVTPQQLLEGTRAAWQHVYSYGSIARRLSGNPSALPVNILANMGYRYYAHHLNDTYNCDWIIGRDNAPAPRESVA